MLRSLVAKFIDPIFEGKCDPLDKNSYQGIKTLEYTFKPYKKILDKRFGDIAKLGYC